MMQKNVSLAETYPNHKARRIRIDDYEGYGVDYKPCIILILLNIKEN